MRKYWTAAKQKRAVAQKRQWIFRLVGAFIPSTALVLFGVYAIILGCQYKSFLSGSNEEMIQEYNGPYEVSSHSIRWKTHYIFHLDTGVKVMVYGEDFPYAPHTLTELRQFSTLRFRFLPYKDAGRLGNIGISVTSSDNKQIIVDETEVVETLQDRTKSSFILGTVFLLVGGSFGCITVLATGIASRIAARYKKMIRRIKRKKN